jgi:hypothetical protein
MLGLRPLLAVLATLVLALAVAPSGAAAQGTNAPPGNSAIDEYLETIPGTTGDRPASPSGAGSNPSSGLTATERKRLEALGPDGRVLAGAIEQTTPARGTGSLSDGKGRPPVASVVEAVGGHDGGSGLGLILPLILLATLLVMLVALLRRRRSSSS